MMSPLAHSYAYCERLARREAGNFYHAFRILPRPQRLAMCALYAFLRITDDLGDSPGEPDAKRGPLSQWRRRLDLALAGVYTHRLHAALHHSIRAFNIPTEYLDAVVEGVIMDVDFAPFMNFDELYRYCYRVASAVGLACIHI